MSPDHPLAPLLRELCPKRYPASRPEGIPALDPIEIYELACRLGARGITLAPPPPPETPPEPSGWTGPLILPDIGTSPGEHPVAAPPPETP